MFFQENLLNAQMKQNELEKKSHHLWKFFKKPVEDSHSNLLKERKCCTVIREA
ncbi:hypothetical protein J7I93_21525 [Bacillus sp. ISL-47]|uniref:hypothetical protein n=1 Tax=Bacillus sp. ISL-47 TaxID=2819130 RepID=UPI001BEC5010|nr:hypothetical protein [Bacillus sp. ISL-47]MBT2690724.1 hypothetical protein [Bacillus sp. ISL-47]MBT2709669.1 hypothetical protein [Pseudomonas sp. ISL-84]